MGSPPARRFRGCRHTLSSKLLRGLFTKLALTVGLLCRQILSWRPALFWPRLLLQAHFLHMVCGGIPAGVKGRPIQGEDTLDKTIHSNFRILDLSVSWFHGSVGVVVQYLDLVIQRSTIFRAQGSIPACAVCSAPLHAANGSRRRRGVGRGVQWRRQSLIIEW